MCIRDRFMPRASPINTRVSVLGLSCSWADECALQQTTYSSRRRCTIGMRRTNTMVPELSIGIALLRQRNMFGEITHSATRAFFANNLGAWYGGLNKYRILGWACSIEPSLYLVLRRRLFQQRYSLQLTYLQSRPREIMNYDGRR